MLKITLQKSDVEETNVKTIELHNPMVSTIDVDRTFKDVYLGYDPGRFGPPAVLDERVCFTMEFYGNPGDGKRVRNFIERHISPAPAYRAPYVPEPRLSGKKAALALAGVLVTLASIAMLIGTI